MTGNTALRTLQLKIGGMSCSFCSAAIERALGRLRGVEEVHVSLAHEEALVRFRPELVDEGRIVRVLRQLGYVLRDPAKTRPFEEDAALRRRELADLLQASAFAAAFVLAMGAMWLDLWRMQDWHAWLAWAAASHVLFWNGRRILKMAWGAILRRITNQHLLLAVGALGGYVGGLLGTPLPTLDWYGLVGFPPVDFFGVVVFLTTYHLLSGYVALWVRARASESVRRLLALQPDVAVVVRDGRELEIPVQEVRAGDHIRVRPGARVAVDGRVLEGRAAVDQSFVTGEPLPVEKGPGDEVIGGSIATDGTLLVQALRVGTESFLHQVARHVEEAKAMKPGIVALVDRVLRWYVPAVLTVALAALIFWSLLAPLLGLVLPWPVAFYAAVTVLVMGYPCALGMATPLALVRGGGMAAERGILVRSGEAFQLLRSLTHVAFDKTGTLTRGQPRLVAAVPRGDLSRERLLQLAASAERHSEHPLARALLAAAREEGLELAEPETFEAVAGRGVRARLGGREITVGSEALLRDAGIDCTPVADALRRERERARTTILVAADGKLLGHLAFADTLEPDAIAAIAELRARGLRTLLLTGDHPQATRRVAAELGIDEFRAGLLPQDKAELVRRWQRERGSRIAFVGDGINDAPALMQAHVGIAIGAGTDIAIESADVVLVSKRLLAVVEAIDIGAASYRKTVQNLWLAFAFNGVGVPVAATGMLHPAWAMAAMVASVSAVLANSLAGRLIWPRRRAGVIAKPASPDAAEFVLEVPSIHCEGCARTIRAALSDLPGIERVAVEVRARRVRVRYDPARFDPEVARARLARMGFTSGRRAA